MVNMPGGIEKQLTEVAMKMSQKWLCLPYSIFVVCISGASYNLFSYFLMIGKMLEYKGWELEVIKWIVLFGYFMGLLPGLIIKTMGGIALFGAAAMALVAFVGLGFITEVEEAGMLVLVLMWVLLFIGACAGSLAFIASIVTSVKNFGKKVGVLVVVLMIAYFKISPYYEFSFYQAFFKGGNVKW